LIFNKLITLNSYSISYVPFLNWKWMEPFMLNTLNPNMLTLLQSSILFQITYNWWIELSADQWNCKMVFKDSILFMSDLMNLSIVDLILKFDRYEKVQFLYFLFEYNYSWENSRYMKREVYLFKVRACPDAFSWQSSWAAYWVSSCECEEWLLLQQWWP